jgi:hypothetical protein
MYNFFSITSEITRVNYLIYMFVSKQKKSNLKEN